MAGGSGAGEVRRAGSGFWVWAGGFGYANGDRSMQMRGWWHSGGRAAELRPGRSRARCAEARTSVGGRQRALQGRRAGWACRAHVQADGTGRARFSGWWRRLRRGGVACARARRRARTTRRRGDEGARRWDGAGVTLNSAVGQGRWSGAF